MIIIMTLVHIVVCFILIMVVLLQSGKAADLAGAFGGGGSQTALGSRGAATLLTKATTGAAVLFMVTSLGLAILASRQTRSVLESAPPVPIEEPAGGAGPDLEGAGSETGGGAENEGGAPQQAEPGSETGEEAGND